MGKQAKNRKRHARQRLTSNGAPKGQNTKAVTREIMRKLQPPPQRTFQRLPSETILSDDCPMYSMYVYIIDGVFSRNEGEAITVGEYKQQNNVSEIRRCELFSHDDARLGDRVE